MPRLPLTAPELLFSSQAPRPWSGFLERPVVAEQGVLLAGDDASAVCMDAATGRAIYTVHVPLEATDAYTGLPIPWSDGRALVPVYQKDASLKVYDVSPAGAIALVDSPGAEEEARGNDMRIVANDGSCKLFLMPLARAADDHYIVSWLYRQVRFYRTECRSFARGLRWGSEEALLATTADVALGVTAPVRGTDDRGTLVARSITDGKVLWSLGARSRTVAGAGAGMFFLLDRSARVSEDAARKIARDEELLEALAEEPALMGEALDSLLRSLLAQRPVRAPSRIAAIDAATGIVRWEAQVPGDVVSIGGPGGGVLAVVGVEGTAAHLYRFDAETGEARGASSLGAGWPGSPLDPWSGRLSFELWSTEMPAIVAVDEHAIAWSSPEALFVERLEEPFTRLWRWTLPAPCRAFRPRVLDRVLNEPAISVGDGRIYLRDGWSLWGIGERR
ncbi:PQQ-binding-like beta-propeller repeat protein [Polyangium sp. 6x1]|uniref:outer membrane protein assembly factor BamB family protein n=1 Tax=Polyangium sp. 6x1 TaxID=3042689 RepID=UPI0024821529|nr:PQQ-binding-like beta-propeller repeat protein [Polyangium sp. 6x1]MDI1443858.1 PQQ-binding-like beta-propeller repeat protein [Polyangium sp. 6x1]